MLSGVAPYYIVNEFPRSGGTWLAKMLSEALDVPFAQHSLPPPRAAILHGHFRAGWGLNNVVAMWRDGRDVLTSYYHYWMFRDSLSDAPMSGKVRADLGFADSADVMTNMPAFIDYCFTRQRYPRFSWSQFVDLWGTAPGVVHARYEALHTGTAAELARIVRDVTGTELAEDVAQQVAADFAFEKRAGRAAGQEDRESFMRKGIVGDWRNCFSREARVAFHGHAGDALITLGYEQDGGWVDAPDDVSAASGAC
ncbi:MAG: sulfotransferase domain-containing protein [Candidatus Poribacteria bacterium]